MCCINQSDFIFLCYCIKQLFCIFMVFGVIHYRSLHALLPTCKQYIFTFGLIIRDMLVIYPITLFLKQRFLESLRILNSLHQTYWLTYIICCPKVVLKGMVNDIWLYTTHIYKHNKPHFQICSSDGCNHYHFNLTWRSRPTFGRCLFTSASL